MEQFPDELNNTEEVLPEENHVDSFEEPVNTETSEVEESEGNFEAWNQDIAVEEESGILRRLGEKGKAFASAMILVSAFNVMKAGTAQAAEAQYYDPNYRAEMTLDDVPVKQQLEKNREEFFDSIPKNLENMHVINQVSFDGDFNWDTIIQDQSVGTNYDSFVSKSGGDIYIANHSFEFDSNDNGKEHRTIEDFTIIGQADQNVEPSGESFTEEGVGDTVEGAVFNALEASSMYIGTYVYDESESASSFIEKASEVQSPDYIQMEKKIFSTGNYIDSYHVVNVEEREEGGKDGLARYVVTIEVQPGALADQEQSQE